MEKMKINKSVLENFKSKTFFNTLLLFFLITISLCLSSNIYASGKQHVSIKTFLSNVNVNPNSVVKFVVQVKIDSLWHLNSNTPNEQYLIPCKVSLDNQQGFTLSKINYPFAENIKLSFSDQPVSVYEKDVNILANLNIAGKINQGKYKLVIRFDYQACNNVSCLPPAASYDTLVINVVNNETAIKDTNQKIFSSIDTNHIRRPNLIVNQSNKVQSAFDGHGLFFLLLLVFIGGLALNLTPCVYPLIPITIGYFGGQSQGNTKRLALMGGLYVFGIALTYSIVGVITALSGAVFGSLLQNTYVVISIVLVLLVLSLSMFGVYEFRLPVFLTAKAGGARSGIYGAFFMGLTMGIVAAPCIGPFVLGLVTFVAAKGDPYLGFLMFFVLALGLGLPYFLLAIFSGKIKSLPRAGEWMDVVKHLFGLIIIGMALYFLLPLIPKNINHFVIPVYMILSSLYILLIDKTGNNKKGFVKVKIILSVMIIAGAVYLLIPTGNNSHGWKIYSDELYTKALKEKKPVIIDFYADWCIPCKELDEKTFSNKNVIKGLNRFIVFKADITKNSSPEIDSLRNNFNIIGVPTIVIIDENGIEKKRITGFVDADEFNKIILSVQ
jgi:thioredoxin:protein disulfide reductase